jgi:lysophospholipase L1-like esterase
MVLHGKQGGSGMPQPPAMMAIGDSLFNGVRSLTINQQLAQWSAPAQVARALGIPFAIPDYSRNVVINFEQWLREFPNVIGIAMDVENNINFWDGSPKSALPEFDNIAIASAVYADLWTRTATVAQAEIDTLHGALGDNFSTVGDHAAALFFAFNTRFLLNPQGVAAASGLSPFAIVAQRQPRRLLVSIGANNGLWEMGFAAEASTGAIGISPTGPFNIQDVADLVTFAGQLTALPAAVEHIYVNALPLPGAVADMMPVPDVSDTHKPGAGNYYPVYENRFGFNYATLTGAQVAANDATVRAVNARLAAETAADPRIHIVPIDQTFAGYDFKTDPTAATVNIDGKVLSNLMTEGPELLFPAFWRGGLMGLDGMHPSIVGYAIMACAILASIEQHEGIAATTPIDIKQAYEADSLLQKVPTSWDIVLDLALDVRRARASGPDQAPTGMKYGAVSGLLSALKFKID